MNEIFYVNLGSHGEFYFKEYTDEGLFYLKTLSKEYYVSYSTEYDNMTFTLTKMIQFAILFSNDSRIFVNNIEMFIENGKYLCYEDYGERLEFDNTSFSETKYFYSLIYCYDFYYNIEIIKNVFENHELLRTSIVQTFRSSKTEDYMIILKLCVKYDVQYTMLMKSLIETNVLILTDFTINKIPICKINFVLLSKYVKDCGPSIEAFETFLSIIDYIDKKGIILYNAIFGTEPNEKIINYLAKNYPESIDARIVHNNTILRFLINRKNYERIKMLLDYGANPNLLFTDGSYLDFCDEKSREILLLYGADIKLSKAYVLSFWELNDLEEKIKFFEKGINKDVFVKYSSRDNAENMYETMNFRIALKGTHMIDLVFYHICSYF